MALGVTLLMGEVTGQNRSINVKVKSIAGSSEAYVLSFYVEELEVSISQNLESRLHCQH
jgi:hypothetical protein